MSYTSDSVKEYVVSKWDDYYAKLAVGQSPTWKCDERTALLFCISQWLMEEMTNLGVKDEDRRKQLWFFNRKARAENDLYALATLTINMALSGDIDQYKGK